MGDDDSNIACLHIYHVGHFEIEPFFLYAKGELTEVKMSPTYMNVVDIKNVVVELGHAEKRIETVYFSRPDVLFKESLVEIKNNDNVRELMPLLERHPHVDLFVLCL